MRKLFLIAHTNMRRAKGQTIAIIVLIFLTALMLNLWFMLSMDYKENFNRYHDKLNAEHVTLSIDEDQGKTSEFLSSTLSKDDQVEAYRLDNCMHMTGTFPYNDGEMNGWFVFLEKDAALNRSIGKIEIVEDSSISSGVYLPMLYKTNDIAIGKPIELSIGSNQAEYIVCGFFNSVMMGSHNCTLTEIVLTQDRYAELEQMNYAHPATLCSIRLKDKSTNLNYEAEIKSRVSKQFTNINIIGNCYDIVVQSRYISQGICSAILAIMALLVLLIALVVIVSNILNYIQVNIKNLGALKAVGYTSTQLIFSLMLQFFVLTFIAAVVGAGLSYCFFPAINTMMIAQTGIPYKIQFLPLPILISLVILCGLVSFFVWLAAYRIKKIEPIVALRSGIHTHNFKRNYIPLEKTKAPLNLALALKTTLSGVKHNITVCVTMLILSLIVVFSGLMIENMIIDMTPFIDMVVGETAHSCISVNVKDEEKFIQTMNSDSRVEKAYLYTSLNVSHVGGAELMATISDDFSKVNNQRVVFQGRFPKYNNEIAIAAKYAREKGLKIGEEIEIIINGQTEKYLISGYTQITNNLGRDCLMTREAYEKLGKLSYTNYYINLKENTDIDAFNAEMKEMFSENINTTINVKAALDGASTVYISLMKVIVIAILVLSIIIITFVLYLLVRTMLNNKKLDYGILKSLGFTTKQLVLQTALTFMPSIILSMLVGLCISGVAINPLMSLFLSTIGIVKCTFVVPVGFISILGIGLILLSFGIACLLSLKVKRISPCTLLMNE